jgi:phage shock protein C
MTAIPPIVDPIQRRLYRSHRDRVLAGVCGGIAEYYGSDPTMIRLVAAVLGVITGIFPLLLLYILAAVIIPEDGVVPFSMDASPTVRPVRTGRGALVLGSVFVIVGFAALVDRVWDVDWQLFGPFVVIAIGAAFVLSALSRWER